MDIERQNFMKEVEAEIKKQNNILAVKPKEVTTEMINELFLEATKKFNTTLKKLKD
jgi:NurA-like 5'-3' nuclease